MHIFQNGSLVIHDVAPEDSGRYTCIAGNSCNIKHTEAPLYVVGMGPARLSTREVGAQLLSHPCFHQPCTQKAPKLCFAMGAGNLGPLLGATTRQSQVPCPELGCR